MKNFLVVKNIQAAAYNDTRMVLMILILLVVFTLVNILNTLSSMSIYLSRSSWGRPADGENCCSISFTDLKGYQAPWGISCECCYTLEGIFIVKKFVLTFSEWLQWVLASWTFIWSFIWISCQQLRLLIQKKPWPGICVKYFLSFPQKNLSPEKTETK